MVVLPALPEASDSEHGGGSTGVPEWQLQDWDDYDFPEDVEREEEVAVEQIHLLQRFPGFISEDIATLLRDLPLPAAGDIPGMTVDEAIQVFHVIQHTMLYTMLCIMLCNIHDTWHVI